MGMETVLKGVRSMAGFALILLIGLTATAQAQTELTDQDRIKQGRERSIQWCAHCHLVAPDAQAQTPVQPDVPSFESIAARPDQSVEKIENGILKPHPPMPTLQLTRDTLRDLALYIMSLRP